MTDSPIDQSKEKLRQLALDIQRERDELRLQLHLASLELHKEWDKVEQEWSHFRIQLQQLNQTSGESAKCVSLATKILGDEIKQGYRRIRAQLN